jgi:acyl-CoA synthetase (AMP-forming)/AMP-acid ligase II
VARRRNHWVNHIARHAHAKPDAVYLRFEGRSVTWSQLEQRVTTVAAAMAQRGVCAGDRGAIMTTNRPEFLETMFVAAHPAVAELAVIGAPDDRWGETPAAIAVPQPGASLTLDELRDWGGARIARYKLPTILHVVTALPRNASGKVLKTELRDRFAGPPTSVDRYYPRGGGSDPR